LLLRDPHPEIRRQSAQWLCLKESADRAPVYVELLKDHDPDVQACALHIMSQVNPKAIPRADLLRLLGSPRLETVTLALSLLQGHTSPYFPTVQPSVVPQRQNQEVQLSSAEAAPLTTNHLTMARLMGLKILRQNADAQAVELTLPLLRDTNSIVRNRALLLLRAVLGQDFPQSDPDKWEQWWATNKADFDANKPAR
jgi:HEAT repeat protein